MPRIQPDGEIQENLHDIMRKFPDVGNPDVKISMDRQKLVEDIALLMRKLPMNTEQVKLVYEAITARMKSKSCYVCARLKPVLGGELKWVDGDMSKPKRWVCEDCGAL